MKRNIISFMLFSSIGLLSSSVYSGVIISGGYYAGNGGAYVNAYPGNPPPQTFPDRRYYPPNYGNPSGVYNSHPPRYESYPSTRYRTPNYPTYDNAQTVDNYVQIGKIPWQLMDRQPSHNMYARPGYVEYWGDGYPVTSVMYSGVFRMDDHERWSGRRMIKMKVNCAEQKVAIISDTYINDQGVVVRETVVRNQPVVWLNVSDVFDDGQSMAVYQVCVN